MCIKYIYLIHKDGNAFETREMGRRGPKPAFPSQQERRDFSKEKGTPVDLLGAEKGKESELNSKKIG